jgi:dihydroflavonol-4-reductase
MTEATMKKVAVTGASGHIGANLVRELISRGYEVVALVRQSSEALEGLALTRVDGDILDLPSLRRAFAGADTVYHLAAYVSIQPGESERFETINVRGTELVIEACLAEKVNTLVYFSTIHALQPGRCDKVIDEDCPLVGQPRQGGEYDYSKAEAERCIRALEPASLNTRIVYPTAVVGPHDFHGGPVGQAILRMARGELPILIEGGYDWVDARDVAWGAVEAAEKGCDGDRFILSGHRVNVVGVARTVAGFSRLPPPWLSCPLWLARLGAPFLVAWSKIRGEAPLYTRYALDVLAEERLVSHARATRVLGYRPRTFRESIGVMIAFYEESGWLQRKRKNGVTR